MTIQTVILAAGQGKRMHSDLPKVLHCLAGKPMLEHVIETARKIMPDVKPVVVYGHQGDVLKTRLAHSPVNWVHQAEQLGTGHALQQALGHISDEALVLVLYGDVPLISVETLKRLIEKTPIDSIGMLTAMLDNPTGYGRIKRDKQQHIVGIVEEKDATADERHIHEVNSGIYLLPARRLKKWLPQLQNKNAQGEYYLTDVVAMAVKEAINVHAVHPENQTEICGINDRIQLAQAERFYQRKQADMLMRQGVTLIDPARVDIRGDVTIGRDVIIDVNVILEGRVVISDGCTIGANTIIRDSELGQRVEVRVNSVIEGASIGEHCVIGPFARLRPDSVLASHAHIGNFVEIKKSEIGEGSKINHLSYIGDSEVGSKVNIGAGTITCNYDGVNKHKTIIGDKAFIGSGTELVAPVTIGAGATIGAGSTITEDAPAEQLTVARAKQHTVQHWRRPEKISKD
jgi:bifunctional UDP-N-acetylglucosamine pyrophosphorylase/glucosamine-1-phosphate N-acetyltransferase